MNVILYILLGMIFWDFSIHVIELLGWTHKFTKSQSILSYYYPHFYWRKSKDGPVVRENWQKPYQRFWVSYWGLAMIFLIVYILSNK